MKPEALWKFILRALNSEECQLWKPHGPHTELQVTDVGNQRSVQLSEDRRFSVASGASGKVTSFHIINPMCVCVWCVLCLK